MPYNDTFLLSNESSSLFLPIDNNDTLLDTEEPSTVTSQRDDISTIEFSTLKYHSDTPQYNNNFLNPINNEYVEEYSNFITSTINFESTTENLNTGVVKVINNLDNTTFLKDILKEFYFNFYSVTSFKLFMHIYK
jgi:hypothetical protein